jgi:hypothetical protein
MISYLKGVAPLNERDKDTRGWGPQGRKYSIGLGYSMKLAKQDLPPISPIWKFILGRDCFPKSHIFLVVYS